MMNSAKRTPQKHTDDMTREELEASAASDDTRDDLAGKPTWSGSYAEAEKEFRRSRGRPPQGKQAKEPVTMRLPAETLKAWRATGKGWQGRLSEDMAKLIPRKA
jgi:uncharacterized protein (DUF4415 family)